jgi:hypothetical protein
LAFITRRYFRSINSSSFIITGSIIGSFLTYAIVHISPKVSNYLYYDVFWKLLWQPLFGNAVGNYYGQLLFLFVTMLLLQIAGSIFGGLLGLRIWMILFRS